MSGKGGRGHDVSKQVESEALSVLDIYVNGIKGVALVDMGCSQSLASKSIYQSWWETELDILIINGNNLKYSRVGNMLDVDNTTPLDIDVLVVDEPVAWVESIQKLGEPQRMECGNVQFTKRVMARCATIKIEEPDLPNSSKTRRYGSGQVVNC